ncbi:AmmeMemoRadiSam system protein B [Acidobacteriota bacterium]
MRKQPSILLFFILFLSCSSFSQMNRAAVYAGQFYDQRPHVLLEQIETFLKQAKKKGSETGDLLALLVPHAGYSCSGAIAAAAYKQIEGRNYKTVIIVGTSHRRGISGGSIYPEGGYETPLGIVQIDKILAQKIAQDSGFGYDPTAHKAEHSIEVQVPFIQVVLPQAKIVPILMGPPTQDAVLALANSFTRRIDRKNMLVVISTDLSHYYPKKKANAIDAQTMALLKNFDIETLMKKLLKGENIMCGGGGVASSLLYTKDSGPVSMDILHYADSSMTCGSPSEVVGYMAAALYSEIAQKEKSLRKEEEEELLSLARTSIKNHLKKKRGIAYSPESSGLLLQRGAFVTLTKDGELRGCIGFTSPVAPLYQTIIQAAISAATRDPRFDPVSSAELRKIRIEISILSPLQKINNPMLIEVGKHGLFIQKGRNSGLLLPQVPVENNWNRLEFLEQACLKAGLPKDSWKSGADLFLFTAVIFHD